MYTVTAMYMYDIQMTLGEYVLLFTVPTLHYVNHLVKEWKYIALHEYRGSSSQHVICICSNSSFNAYIFKFCQRCPHPRPHTCLDFKGGKNISSH